MVPGRAVDGATNSIPADGECFHSKSGYWWMVDLGELFMVNEVAILTRNADTG